MIDRYLEKNCTKETSTSSVLCCRRQFCINFILSWSVLLLVKKRLWKNFSKIFCNADTDFTSQNAKFKTPSAVSTSYQTFLHCLLQSEVYSCVEVANRGNSQLVICCTIKKILKFAATIIIQAFPIVNLKMLIFLLCYLPLAKYSPSTSFRIMFGSYM